MIRTYTKQLEQGVLDIEYSMHRNGMPSLGKAYLRTERGVEYVDDLYTFLSWDEQADIRDFILMMGEE